MCSSEALEICWTAFIKADHPTFNVRASVRANGRPVKKTHAARRSSSFSVRRYSARKSIFLSFDVVPAIASAVSEKSRIPSFSLHQNLETFAHPVGENQSLHPHQALHRNRIAGGGKSLHFIQHTELDQVVLLRREQNRF